jgi:hypothetical protein
MPFAEGGRESYRASQRRSRRQPLLVFEPGNSDGTRIVTIKIFFLKISRGKIIAVMLRNSRIGSGGVECRAMRIALAQINPTVGDIGGN